jgi:hypothetical protein
VTSSHLTVIGDMSTFKFFALASLLCLAACDVKDSNDVNLETLTQPAVLDNTPPVPTGQVPAAGLSGPLAISQASIRWSDPMGSNGATPSRVNPPTVTATASGRSLPVSQTGDTYTAQLSGLSDGPITITWTAKDFAGNLATFTMTFYLKNTGPVIATTMTPPTSMQTNAATATLTWSGNITDPFVQSAVAIVNRPAGPTGTCGSSGDTPAPQGTGAGQVQANTFDLTQGVKANGSFNVTVTAFNAATTSSVPVTTVDCLQVTTSDAAMDALGAPKPNITVKNYPVALTWLPVSVPPLSVTATYKVSPTLSQVCLAIATNPPRAGATYSGVMTGPGFGPATFTGGLDNTGSALARVNITQTGTYSGSVNVGSLAATFSVNVATTGGTCP